VPEQTIPHLGDAGAIHLSRGESSLIGYGGHAPFGFCKQAAWLAVVCEEQ
jgi:hypothetical protein